MFARRSEYYTLLSTFVLIQALGLVPGLVAGCGVASIDFMVEAVGAATPVRVDRQSLALRTRPQKAYLRSPVWKSTSEEPALSRHRAGVA